MSDRGCCEACGDVAVVCDRCEVCGREVDLGTVVRVPPEPTRAPCPRCGKPLARRGVYHVCPHRVPCGSSGWCRVCADRSGA